MCVSGSSLSSPASLQTDVAHTSNGSGPLFSRGGPNGFILLVAPTNALCLDLVTSFSFHFSFRFESCLFLFYKLIVVVVVVLIER